MISGLGAVHSGAAWFNDGVIGQVGLGERIAIGAGTLFYGEYVRNVAAFES